MDGEDKARMLNDILSQRPWGKGQIAPKDHFLCDRALEVFCRVMADAERMAEAVIEDGQRVSRTEVLANGLMLSLIFAGLAVSDEIKRSGE